MAHVLRFEDREVRQERVDGIVGEVDVRSGLEVAVREQQRRVKHDTGEGEKENQDTHATGTFFKHLSHACVCTRMKMHKVRSERAVRRKMCV